MDVINGFCKFGSLASERVGQIVPPTARLLEAPRDLGVTRVAVLRDSHHPEAPEFEQFAPHCQDGTEEAALVDELAGLSHAHTFADFPKNSISAWHGHDAVSDWVASQEAAGVSTFVVCGDCTDLCVYQTAMALKLTANARNRRATVVVSAETVETYDLPVDVAQRLGAMPHDGDLLHAVFLYHLRSTGCRWCAVWRRARGGWPRPGPTWSGPAARPRRRSAPGEAQRRPPEGRGAGGPD